jgi:hypothetical protein
VIHSSFDHAKENALPAALAAHVPVPAPATPEVQPATAPPATAGRPQAKAPSTPASPRTLVCQLANRSWAVVSRWKGEKGSRRRAGQRMGSPTVSGEYCGLDGPAQRPAGKLQPNSSCGR